MLRKVASLTLVAAGLICSLQASAATYSIGALSLGDNEFGVYEVGKALFEDRINFDIGEPVYFSGGVGSLKVTVGITDKRDIQNLTLKIYDNANNLLSTAPGSTPTNLTLSSSLLPGQYYALVSGQGTGSLGGKYGGVFTIAPVPEPETWAMMLAGLGLVSAGAKRRKEKKEKEEALA